MLKKVIQGVLLGLAAAGISLAVWTAGWLDRVENPAWDLRVRTFAKPGPFTDSIRLIMLDQTSLDWAREAKKLSWPWPRTAYALMSDFCRRGGARAVVFDVVFTEPSAMAVEEDQELGASLAQTRSAVTALLLSREQGLTTQWPPAFSPKRLKVEGLEAYVATPAGQRLVMPKASFSIPEVTTNSAFVGTVMADPEADTVVRRLALFRVFDGNVVPSLGLAAFLARDPDVPLRLSGNDLTIGAYRIPLDSRGQAILRYRGPSQTHQTVNASFVIESELRARDGKPPLLDPSFFHDKYVFFGTTASGLLDLKSTPISTVSPAFEVHATLLDNLLTHDFMRDARAGGVILITLFLTMAAAVLGRLSQGGIQTILTFVLLLPVPVAIGFVAYINGAWFPVAAPELAVILALVSAVILNYTLEGRQKRFIKNAFNRYLSPHVIDQLVNNPDQLRLGGESRELTIFFSDIEGFTTISEALGPEKLTALLNDYLTAMTDIILAEGGTVDKYIGDAIVAFWNAPLDLKDHANAAVCSALRCQARLAELRPAFKERTGFDLFCRIGINTGTVVVGNVGSAQRFDYSFLGDAGNLAARLEGLNKQFGTYLMISEFTQRQLGPEFAARELSRVRVKGKNEPVRVFEPMFRADYEAKAPLLNRFQAALRLYYDGRFAEALAEFLAMEQEDAVSAAYARRCRDLIDHPPPEWDGVWTMKEK